jgi:ABC-type xylose transport system substrate-binding protein
MLDDIINECDGLSRRKKSVKIKTKLEDESIQQIDQLENRIVQSVQVLVIQSAEFVEVENGYEKPIQATFITFIRKSRIKFGLF